MESIILFPACKPRYPREPYKKGMCEDGRLETLDQAPGSPHLRAKFVKFRKGGTPNGMSINAVSRFCMSPREKVMSNKMGSPKSSFKRAIVSTYPKVFGIGMVRWKEKPLSI